MNNIEKQQIEQCTHWPDEIIDSIVSMEEAEIYMRARQKAARIGNRWALIRSDINWADFSIRRNTLCRTDLG